MSLVYFFGCISLAGHHVAGHFLYAPGTSREGVRSVIDENGATPWAVEELDAALLGGGFASTSPEDQPQGLARLHHRDGWTVLTLWDRTGDRRHGSNSALVAEGLLNFDAMTALFVTAFPVLWARITATDPARSHPGNPVPTPARLRIAPTLVRIEALATPSMTTTSPQIDARDEDGDVTESRRTSVVEP